MNPASNTGPRPIDVIVPVYKGLAETRRCLESVLHARGRQPLALIVVDDCTPEPELAAYLGELEAAGDVTLLRHESNQGFVVAANHGMALHPDRDLVLLNSDTEVAGDWLDRLHRCAHSAPDIGTVTPFSNNATICSYPFEGWDGGLPGRLGLVRLDALVAAANAGEVVDLPTGVGFCLYIRRACLEQVGPFDAAAFGHGYGEESDFCLRAAARGWRSVLAGDVWVYHEGSVSFGATRAERTAAAERRMRERHPHYPAAVLEFLARDPVLPLRQRIDRARGASSYTEARAVVEERIQEQSLRVAMLAHYRNDAEHYRGEASHYRNQASHYRKTLDACREERRQGAAEAATLGRLLGEARTQFAECDQALAAATGFVRAREADLVALQARHDSLEQQLARLQGVLDQARQDRQRAADELAAQRAGRCWRLCEAVRRRLRSLYDLTVRK